MGRDWTDATDLQLLAACREGEEPFAEFYRRHERLVAAWLVRRCPRADMVPDLVAEVFAAAYVGAPRFRAGPEPAAAWLLGIARNKLLHSLRRDRVEASARRRFEIEPIELSEESTAAIGELASFDPVELLRTLPDEQREAVEARVLEDLDYRQVAKRLQITPAAARQRVSRGLSSLRRRLQHQGAQQ